MIIQRYAPQATWLWRQWYGTVLHATFASMVINMVYAAIFCLVMGKVLGDPGQAAAVSTTFLKQELAKIGTMWQTLLGLTNFLVTFFASQAFTFWRSFMSTGRSVQGRISDISMLLATHAARDGGAVDNSNKKMGGGSSTLSSSFSPSYTLDAQVFLQLLAHKLRLVHILAWAGAAKRFRILLTRKGMDRMVERGLLLDQERDQLLSLHVSPTNLWIHMLESAMMDCQEAIRDPKIVNRAYVSSSVLERSLVENFLTLRGLLSSLPNMVSDRMPLAYVHFTQLLVDIFLVVSPIARYEALGWWIVVGMGLLTLFYRGFLNLAKVFLDPLDNEDFCEGCVYLDVGVLIRESNIGSTKFMNAAA